MSDRDNPTNDPDLDRALEGMAREDAGLALEQFYGLGGEKDE